MMTFLKGPNLDPNLEQPLLETARQDTHMTGRYITNDGKFLASFVKDPIVSPVMGGEPIRNDAVIILQQELQRVIERLNRMEANLLKRADMTDRKIDDSAAITNGKIDDSSAVMNRKIDGVKASQDIKLDGIIEELGNMRIVLSVIKDEGPERNLTPLSDMDPVAHEPVAVSLAEQKKEVHSAPTAATQDGDVWKIFEQRAIDHHKAIYDEAKRKWGDKYDPAYWSQYIIGCARGGQPVHCQGMNTQLMRQIDWPRKMFMELDRARQERQKKDNPNRCWAILDPEHVAKLPPYKGGK